MLIITELTAYGGDFIFCASIIGLRQLYYNFGLKIVLVVLYGYALESYSRIAC